MATGGSPKLGRKLGEGGFGAVYEGDKGKAVKKIEIDPRADRGELMKELELLEQLKHERIIKYYGHYFSPTTNTLYIELELMQGGSVADQIKREGSLSETLTLKYTRQILEGVSYLHSKHIIHRDIKGANVLCDGKGNVKLADFGVSKQTKKISAMGSTNFMADYVKSAAKTIVGTRPWMAPEIFNEESYDSKVDIWSVGCTVVEMLTGKPPNPGNPQPSYTLPSGCSEQTVKLLTQTFQKSAHDRPSADDLLRQFF